MKKSLLRGVAELLARAPGAAAAAIEEASARAQGKGWSGGIDAEVAAVLSFLDSTVSEPIKVIDVGANAGAWTAELLRLAPRSVVWALEPSRGVFPSLEERFRDENRVQTERLGISDEAGERRLWAPEAGSGLGSLHRRRLNHFGMTFDGSETIRVTTLDDFCRRQDFWPQVIKLDIEGHEFAALCGARTTLESATVIQFEFGGTNIDSRVFWQDFWYLFEETDFSLFRLTPRGVQPINKYSEADEVFRFTNYFAAKTLS